MTANAMKRRLLLPLAIALLACAVVLGLHGLGEFERLEGMAYDAMVRLVRADKAPHPDVAIVLIDEASVRAMNPVVGRWPWPRSLHAELIDFIAMGNPKSIAFDVLFPEYEGDRCAQGGKGIYGPNDALLVEATRNAGNVHHAMNIFKDTEDELNKGLLDRPMPSEVLKRFPIQGLRVEGDANNYSLPIPELAQAAWGLANVEFPADPDGIYRRVRPVVGYQGHGFAGMGLSLAADVMKPQRIALEPGSLVMDDLRLPLDKQGRYLINLYGQFKPYSISGIFASIQKLHAGDLEGMMVSPEEFEGKVVIIGASAVGIEDLKATSISTTTPGVYLHASMMSNILLRDYLRPPPAWLTRALVVITALLSVASVVFMTGMWGRAALPVLLLLVHGFACAKSFEHNVLLEVVPPAMAIFMGTLSAFVYVTFTEGREKRKVRKMLGQYVSPHALAALADKYEDALKAEIGSKEYVTILFSDIRGFTTISERESAERIVGMLNYYFSAWADEIFKHEGAIDKFVGDAVMAIWGAPVRTQDHPQQAIRTALRMVERMPQINEHLAALGYPEVRVGIGINTGYAVQGNIGSERKLDYTVIGDTVNLASRLEGLTKNYACDILVSEFTYEHIKDQFICIYADEVKVKGKDKAVKVYKVEGEAHDKKTTG